MRPTRPNQTQPGMVLRCSSRLAFATFKGIRGLLRLSNDLEYEDDHKNEDNLKNEDDIKYDDNLKYTDKIKYVDNYE